MYSKNESKNMRGENSLRGDSGVLLAKSVIALAAMSALIGSIAACNPTAPAPEPVYAMGLRPKLEAMYKDMAVPGAVVLVQSREQGNWSATFGTRRIGSNDPITIDDHYRIGSNTKTMTGTVVLQLVQEGRLGLDDPVSKYHAGVPNGSRITIGQMLSMRSGLFSYTASPEWARAVDETPQRAWAPEELLAMGFARKPNFAPGQGFNYSNTNTVLLGLIIEKLTGDPLDVAFDKRLFKPLGLTRTFLPKRDSSTIPQPHPRAYHFGTFAGTQIAQGGKLPPDEQAAARAGTLLPNDGTDTNPSMAWAAGGVISTAPELARYVKAMVGGGLLGKEMQQRRFASLQPAEPKLLPGYRYGYNWDTFGPMIGHEGDMPGGFTSVMYHDPNRDITIIVWTTLADHAINGLDPADETLKAIFPTLYPGQPLPNVLNVP
jgi:D-alanyl-D-alanine carboxypeptidase